MDAPQESATLDEVLALYEAGKLFNGLKRLRTDAADSALLLAVIELHNAGRIDLTAMAERPEYQALTGHQIYVAQDFFNRAIPRLTATGPAMMTFVAALVAKAGQDMTAGRANGAFIDWCKVDPSRSRAVIDLAEAGDTQATGFLYLALQALGDPVEARRLTLAFDDKRREGALLALGAISHPTDIDRQATMAVLGQVLASAPDDQTRARLLGAVIRIHASTTLPPEAIQIVTDALAPGGDTTLHEAAQVLWEKPPVMTATLAAPLLAVLMAINPAHKGTIKFLDIGLTNLAESGLAAAAITFVTNLLSQSDGEIALSQLDGFRDALWKGPSADFHGAVVAWWLSGNHALAEGLEMGFRRPRTPQVLSIDLVPFALSDARTESLCRKAIGYSFLQPVTAASVLVSALRSAGKPLARTIEDLLFDPLLTNYGGDLADYLKGIDQADAAYPAVQRVLRRKAKYLKGLDAPGEIKELHPAESRRQAERVRWFDDMQASAKAARKQSVFFGAIRESVLLYGRQSLTMVQDPGGTGQQPVQTVLQRHGVSMEFPRMQVLDPVGLHEMLVVLRSEAVQP